MASGDTLVVFHPYNNEPPAANYATLDTRNATNPIPCLDFDAATNESAIFSGIMPRHYAGGGVTVYLWWAASTDTTDTHHCYWDVGFEVIEEGGLDLDGDSFAAVNSVDTDHCNATSGITTVTEVAFTDGADMDSVGVGDMFRMIVTRDAASDDMTGDGELYAVEIKET
jgi:hypothetical protein